MNGSYLLKIKYLLGLSQSKEIFDWAFQQAGKGNTSSDLLDILSMKEGDQAGIIESLSKIANSQSIDTYEVKECFYSLFIDIFEKSMDMVHIEGLLLQFYRLVKDDIDFDDNEKLSLTIIENDLSLRMSNLPFQITENDIIEFLRMGVVLNKHLIKRKI